MSPVKLKYAISQFFCAITGVNTKNTYAKVKVKNIGDHKKVLFIYKQADGNWKSEPLALEATYPGYEIYATKNIPVTEEFAIKYTVDDIDHWDNNNGSNYHLLANRVNNVIGENVVLHKATAKTDPNDNFALANQTFWLEGEIYVRRKICYHKKVGIKISADNGITWQEIDAGYEYPVSEGSYIDVALGELEVELWKFKTPTYNYNPASDSFKFAVYCQNLETGAWYWDNNFGQDYQISKKNDSTIE